MCHFNIHVYDKLIGFILKKHDTYNSSTYEFSHVKIGLNANELVRR